MPFGCNKFRGTRLFLHLLAVEKFQENECARAGFLRHFWGSFKRVEQEQISSSFAQQGLPSLHEWAKASGHFLHLPRFDWPATGKLASLAGPRAQLCAS